MSCIQFIRTTHHKGGFRPFPAEALQFWREYGAVVGEALRPECPLTFAEIVVVCQEHALEHPEAGLLLPLDEAYVAWCLIKLVEYGMVGVVGEMPDQPMSMPRLQRKTALRHLDEK